MKIFLRILKLTIPYKITILLAFLSSILFGLFNAFSLWVVGSLIGTLMGAKETTINNLDNASSFHQKLDYYFDQLFINSDQIERLKIVCLL